MKHRFDSIFSYFITQILSQVSTRLFFTLLSILSVTSMAAIGCGWFGGDEHSVRFNYSSVREFGLLPRIQAQKPGVLSETKKAQPGQIWRNQDDSDDLGQLIDEADTTWAALDEAFATRNETTYQRILERYLELTEVDFFSDYQEPTDVQARRNSAIDQLDALTARKQGSSSEAVWNYIEARQAFDNQPEDQKEKPKVTKLDHNVRDNVAFLSAAVLYAQQDYTAAATAFRKLARRYPTSEKREAALYLAALSEAKCTVAFWASDPETDSPTPDEDWADLRRAFQRVLNEYPNGRYKGDVLGWLGFMNLQFGNRPQALVYYYKQLSIDDPIIQRQAVKSLRLVRQDVTEVEMYRLQQILSNDPETALTYTYHELYNYTQMIDQFEADCSCGEGEDDESWVRGQYQRIAGYSATMMDKFPQSKLSGGFALRAAMANLESGDHPAAIKLARQALRLGLKGIERARGLWVLGVAQYRHRQLEAAAKSFTQLIQEFPTGDLVEGTRRHLAMLAEELGRRDVALEQYLALNYQLDVAYLIDVMMTPEELHNFITTHPQSDELNELWYALGIRYLRHHQWTDAREAFANVRTISDSIDEQYHWNIMTTYDYQNLEPQLKPSPKSTETDIDWKIKGIRSRWLHRDLQTIDDLEFLQSRIDSAQDDTQRAEAMYQFASYVYQGGSFLFYNPAAWQGMRYSSIAVKNDFSLPNEEQQLWNYHLNHEAVAQAKTMFLAIVDAYPRSPAAPDALYTAAVCDERLINFSPYWRAMSQTGRHAGSRWVTYDDVRRQFPGYQLPRGTFGWEPSTRTVNGGPGLEPKPKPLPRKSRLERALEKLAVWSEPIISFGSSAWQWYKGYLLNLPEFSRKWSEWFWSVTSCLYLIPFTVLLWMLVNQRKQRFLDQMNIQEESARPKLQPRLYQAITISAHTLVHSAFVLLLWGLLSFTLSLFG